MSESGINYAALFGAWSKNTSLNITGKGTEKESVLNDLGDGLSYAEMKSLDSDKDGILTLAEFKKAISENKLTDSAALTLSSKSYFNKLAAKALEVAEVSKEQTVINKTTGDITTTYTKGSVEYTEVYDKNGNILSYSTKTTNKDGSTRTDFSKYENGVRKSKGTTITSEDKATGAKTSETINYDLNNKITSISEEKTSADSKAAVKTSIAADGKTVTSKTLTDANGNSTVINYDDSGAVKSVKIGDKTYTNVTKAADGTVTIKDDSGKNVYKIQKVQDTMQYVSFDSSGKALSKLCINSSGIPYNQYTYSDVTINGQSVRKCTGAINLNNGAKTVYQFDPKTGQRLSAVKTFKTGAKTQYTYADDGKTIEEAVSTSADGKKVTTSGYTNGIRNYSIIKVYASKADAKNGKNPTDTYYTDYDSASKPTVRYYMKDGKYYKQTYDSKTSKWGGAAAMNISSSDFELLLKGVKQ